MKSGKFCKIVPVVTYITMFLASSSGSMIGYLDFTNLAFVPVLILSSHIKHIGGDVIYVHELRHAISQ